MVIGDRVSEGGNAICDVVEAFGEQLVGKECRAHWMDEEVEILGEFNRELLCDLISRLRYGDYLNPRLRGCYNISIKAWISLNRLSYRD